MKNYRIYAKFPDMSKFKALDISKGAPVDNLIYATLINSEELGKAKEYLNLVKADQPKVYLQIREINNTIIFSI